MTSRRNFKTLILAALSAGAAVLPAGVVMAQDATGYANLVSRGVLQRNGAGQQILQVEALGATWGVNTGSGDFTGKAITAVGNAGVSDHAT